MDSLYNVAIEANLFSFEPHDSRYGGSANIDVEQPDVLLLVLGSYASGQMSRHRAFSHASLSRKDEDFVTHAA